MQKLRDSPEELPGSGIYFNLWCWGSIRIFVGGTGGGGGSPAQKWTLQISGLAVKLGQSEEG